MPNKKETFKKLISLVLGVMIISLALGVWGMAFTEPSREPPEENASAPLNIGTTGQTKSGWLATLDSLWIGLQHPGGNRFGLMQVLNGALININGASLGLAVPHGKVGIGTQSPEDGFAMEVSGDIKLSDDLAIPGSQDFTIKNVKSPVDDSDVATKEYVNSKKLGSTDTKEYIYADVLPPEEYFCLTNLRFAGYTGLFTGKLSGFHGADNKCKSAYPQYNNDKYSVHWCSVKELMELGSQYTYQFSVWARDASLGVVTSPPYYWSLFGGAGATTTLGGISGEGTASCLNWTNDNSMGLVYEGPIILSSGQGGRIGIGSCWDSYRLACCYYGD